MPGIKENNSHYSPDLRLTEQSMAFARAVVYDTKREKTRTQHYRDIFGSEKPNKSVEVMSSRLWNAPVLKAYVEELRAEVRERFMVSVESLIEELHEIKLVALQAETPQCSAAVAAVMGKAKLAGLDKVVEEKVKIDGARTVTIVRAVKPSEED